MTHNGRVYSPEPQKKNNVVVKDKIDALLMDKGKVVMDTNQEQESPSKNFTDQEAEEFLKIINTLVSSQLRSASRFSNESSMFCSCCRRYYNKPI